MHLEIRQLLNPSMILIRLQNFMEFFKNFNTNFNAKSIRWLAFISLLNKIIKELYSCLTCCCTQSLPNIFSFFTMNVSNAKTSKGVWAVFVKPSFFFYLASSRNLLELFYLSDSFKVVLSCVFNLSSEYLKLIYITFFAR